ncbi:hypothetical protein [Ruegeria jejuensis]|uniref:hypothetical protein n=1 Tax=Ruegeria jejuensis TaxID=3233338 RepID=UPI00355B4154
MSIRTRLRKLESSKQGTKAEVLIRRLIYEGRPGEPDEEPIVTAYIIWGYLMMTNITKSSDETEEAFHSRVTEMSQMSWPEAKLKYGLEG